MRIYIPAPAGNAGAVELNPAGTSAAAHKFLVYHYDHLGSIQAVTNWGATGASAIYPWTEASYKWDLVYSYEPWGQRRDAEDWQGAASSRAASTSSTVHTWGWDNPATTTVNEDDPISRGFTGHEMLDDLGWVYMNGRIYDPLLERFLSAYPVIPFPGSVQGYNCYSYVLNIEVSGPIGFVATAVAIYARYGPDGPMPAMDMQTQAYLYARQRYLAEERQADQTASSQLVLRIPMNLFA